jgi:hypothetical protein
MLLLHLLELAFGQLFLNHTWLGVCVLVRDVSWCRIESTVITSRLLLSHASFVFDGAGLRTARFYHTWLGVCVLVCTPSCCLIV